MGRAQGRAEEAEESDLSGKVTSINAHLMATHIVRARDSHQQLANIEMAVRLPVNLFRHWRSDRPSPHDRVRLRDAAFGVPGCGCRLAPDT
jgi:hypothetical protein